MLNEKQVIIHTSKRLVLKEWLFFQKFSSVVLNICHALIMMVWLFSSFIQKKKPHLQTKLRTNRDNIWRFKDEPHGDSILTENCCEVMEAAVHFLQRGCALSWKRPNLLLLPLQHPWNAISPCCGNFPIDTLFIHTATLLALSWQGILFHTHSSHL